ncbi:helix-turn-helix domain-containing protein [Ramlibacter sp. AN1133]|uniref:helix-turn-helix domain-containing protein n=1 Tax=Ramlibacter sp. AN1133 TaxID=3133429 RepID=UPI0030C04E12
MPNIQSALKAEISRLARKEVRSEIDALKKSSAQQRSQIASMRKTLDAVLHALRRVQHGAAAPAAKPAADEAGDHPPRRWSAERFAKHRQRLQLSAADMGQLIGVSGQSIYKWEAGEARPRRAQLEAIAAVRGLGTREVQARLQQMRKADPVGADKPKARKAPRKQAAPRAAKKPSARKAA